MPQILFTTVEYTRCICLIRWIQQDTA